MSLLYLFGLCEVIGNEDHEPTNSPLPKNPFRLPPPLSPKA